MATYYNPNGNPEEWDEKPSGYYTEDEWAAMHPAPEPTKEEKLAELDAQYDADKAEIVKYFNEAQLAEEAELQAELRAEMTAIDAQYVEDRKAIEEEGDE